MKADESILSAEITGIAAVITGLSNQLDDRKTDALTVDAMKNALFGISSYLERIAYDLVNIDRKAVRHE